MTYPCLKREGAVIWRGSGRFLNAFECFEERGEGFFGRSERSGILEVELLGEGVTPLPSRGCMRGCEMKVCNAGFT